MFLLIFTSHFPPNSSQIYSHPIPLPVLFFFFVILKLPIKFSLYCLYILGCRDYHWNKIELLGPTPLRKNYLSPGSHQPLIASHSQGMGLQGPTLLQAERLTGLVLYKHQKKQKLAVHQSMLSMEIEGNLQEGKSVCKCIILVRSQYSGHKDLLPLNNQENKVQR